VPNVPGGEFTQILSRLQHGDGCAKQELFDLVYRELHALAARQMRGERHDHTLQSTALVHEAYLRLFGGGEPTWENRAHFFGTAAEVMRRILVDHARSRGTAKRGGGANREELPDQPQSVSMESTEVLAIDEALADLEREDAPKAEIVKLRYFSGLSLEEIAEGMGMSLRTVKRQWSFARAWLYRRIRAE
jgi:RNA polymerase sigma factor (TIGR02999 family)